MAAAAKQRIWETAGPLIIQGAESPEPKLPRRDDAEVRGQVLALLRAVRISWSAERISASLDVPVVPVVWALAGLQRDELVEPSGHWEWRYLP